MSGRAWGGCSGAAGGEMGLERPKREELPALQEPEGSRLLTVRSVPLLLSQPLSPAWPLPAAMHHNTVCPVVEVIIAQPCMALACTHAL